MAYSLSPERNRVRVIVTSEKSMARRPAELSIVSSTSARPSGERFGVPAKMTSSIFPERSMRVPWAPRTHATASTRLDFPLPFGPTTTVTPGSNSRVAVSANDLKPLRVSDFRNTLPSSYRQQSLRRGIRVRRWSDWSDWSDLALGAEVRRASVGLDPGDQAATARAG